MFSLIFPSHKKAAKTFKFRGVKNRAHAHYFEGIP